MKAMLPIGLGVCLALISSSGVGKKAAPVSPLSRYSAMSTPRSEVPIGARWIVGTGPDGSATSEDNIVVSKGLTSVVLSSEVQKKIAFSLGSFLGLDANRARTVSATYTNLEIHRVKSLSALTEIRAGEDILYEAVRANQITLSVDESSGAAVKAAAEAKGIAVSLGGSSGGKSTIKLDGSNLFIAYQAVRLSPATTLTRQASLDGGGREAVVGDFRFVFNAKPYTGCICGGGNPNTCADKSVRVLAMDLTAPRLDGTYDSRPYEVAAHDLNLEVALIEQRKQNVITASRARFSIQPSFSGRGTGVCVISFDKKFNWVKITSSSFQIAPLQSDSSAF